MGYREGQLPLTESISGRLLRLPFYHDLKREEQDEVVSLIRRFFKGTGHPSNRQDKKNREREHKVSDKR